MRLGLRDLRDFFRNRGKAKLTVAGYVIFVFTGILTYWAIIAWLGLIIAVSVFFLGYALLGRNRTWKREYIPQPYNRMQLSLTFKGSSAARLSRVQREFILEVRDPLGMRHKADHVSDGGDMVDCIYPDRFPGAPVMTPGAYIVSWQQQEPTGVGKWRLIDVGGFTVPQSDV
jgi:hypothetical protein